MRFDELDLSEELKLALKKKGFVEPTEVQEKTLPILLEGKDLIIRSKTGSGKTLGFLIPILQRLERGKGLQAVILAPTRELAVQIDKDLRAVSKIKSVTVYGGVSINPQIEGLKTAEVMIGTPGRVVDILNRGALPRNNVRFAVLDEADRMLEMGMIEDVDYILSAMPKERQTSLWSATMPPEIQRLSSKYQSSPEEVILQKDEIAVEKIDQVFYGLDRKKKISMLMRILREKGCERAIVFCNTKRWSDSLSKILFRKGVKCKALHADLSQAKRNFVIQDFKRGKFDVLIATDVAARGLHVDGITHVVNYDIPRNPKDYVHRIGRTGRAGADGNAISFLTNTDGEFLRGIERELQSQVQVMNVQEDWSLAPALAPEPVPQETSLWDRMD